MLKPDVTVNNGVTTIAASEVINAPQEVVWNALKVIGDIEKFHPLVKKSRATTEKLSGLGAKRHCTLLPMGQMEEEVVGWVDGQSFEMEVTGGKFLPPYHFMQGKVELKAIEQKTEVTFKFTYVLKFGAMGRLMDSIMIRPQFKKAPPQYISGLKQYVESI